MFLASVVEEIQHKKLEDCTIIDGHDCPRLAVHIFATVTVWISRLDTQAEEALDYLSALVPGF